MRFTMVYILLFFHRRLYRIYYIIFDIICNSGFTENP